MTSSRVGELPNSCDPPGWHFVVSSVFSSFCNCPTLTHPATNNTIKAEVRSEAAINDIEKMIFIWTLLFLRES